MKKKLSLYIIPICLILKLNGGNSIVTNWVSQFDAINVEI